MRTLWTSNSAIVFAAAAGISLLNIGSASAQPLPGSGTLPNDGFVIAGITQACGGNPACIAAAWGTVEVGRCRNGYFVPGGCFGPNGEIMRVVNQVLPPHLRPNTIVNNIQSDIQNGPGDGNDITGKDGWLRKRLGF